MEGERDGGSPSLSWWGEVNGECEARVAAG